MKTDFVASWVVLVVGVAYALAAWLVQMHRVAPPRDWLQQRIWYLKTLIDSGPWPKGSEDWPSIEHVQVEIEKRWIRVPISKVQAGWRNIHGFEDMHLLDLPAERVDAQLRTAQTRLAAVPRTEAAGFVGRIAVALKANDPPTTPEARAALLREAEIFGTTSATAGTRTCQPPRQGDLADSRRPRACRRARGVLRPREFLAARGGRRADQSSLTRSAATSHRF